MASSRARARLGRASAPAAIERDNARAELASARDLLHGAEALVLNVRDRFVVTNSGAVLNLSAVVALIGAAQERIDRVEQRVEELAAPAATRSST